MNRWNPTDPTETLFVWCPGCSVGMTAPGLPADCPHCGGPLGPARYYPAEGPDGVLGLEADPRGDGVELVVEGPTGPRLDAVLVGAAAEAYRRALAEADPAVELGAELDLGSWPGPAVPATVEVEAGPAVVGLLPGPLVVLDLGASGVAVGDRVEVGRSGPGRRDGFVGRFRRVTVWGLFGDVLEVELVDERTGGLRSVRVERLNTDDGR